VSSDEVKISPHKFIMQEWGFYWRVSDCEELVGVTHRRLCGGFGG